MVQTPNAANPMEAMEETTNASSKTATPWDTARFGVSMGHDQPRVLANRGFSRADTGFTKPVLDRSRSDPLSPRMGQVSNDLANRRMRARMYGGVRGGRQTLPPTRFLAQLRP